MTEFTAKLLALQVALDWQSRNIWLVRERVSESVTQFRWFKSEENARNFAARMPNSTVEACPAGVVEFTDDGLDGLRERIAQLLDGRRRRMPELGYTDEFARG